jgi:hypothetical protein
MKVLAIASCSHHDQHLLKRHELLLPFLLLLYCRLVALMTEPFTAVQLVQAAL